MKIREIEAYFQTLYPDERKCEWDNDGLLICPDREREVRKILTCLDVTFPAIERARAEGCDLIVSHHPLIFSPIKSITEDSIVGQKILLLLDAKISLISLHTRFDAALGGLNERFGAKMGIIPERDVVLLQEEPFIGGIGNLPVKYPPEVFAQLVSEVLSHPVKLYSAGLDVGRIGYCCGSGKDLGVPCNRHDADAFVGGDIPYHVAQNALEMGMTVIDCGHFASEAMATSIFAENLSALDLNFEIIEFHEELGGEIVGFC